MTSSTSERNQTTVAAYDAYAAKYAEVTAPGRSKYGFGAVERFVAAVGEGARVLEVASGPGWDADAMETAGLNVRRTDASDGFIAVQAERGKVVERLDLLSDDLGGSWDGIVALYVLQHVERERLPGVLARMVAALRPDGVLLISFQEGDGEGEQEGSEGGLYRVLQWRPEAMSELIARCGLTVFWRHSFEGDEARWVAGDRAPFLRFDLRAAKPAA